MKKILRYPRGIAYCSQNQVNRYLRVKGNRAPFRGNLKAVYCIFQNIIGKYVLGSLTSCPMITLLLRFFKKDFVCGIETLFIFIARKLKLPQGHSESPLYSP